MRYYLWNDETGEYGYYSDNGTDEGRWVAEPAASPHAGQAFPDA